MGKLTLNSENTNATKYIWRGTHPERTLAKDAGFDFEGNGIWTSPDPYRAMSLFDFADSEARRDLLPLVELLHRSKATSTNFEIPAPDGLEYFPFQVAGIESVMEDRISYLGDDMGVGKTIQAIGVSNYLKHKSILVICPASLRIKWARELQKWSTNQLDIRIIFSGVHEFERGCTHIISYNLMLKNLDNMMLGEWDHIIVDEAHYLKNIEAKRTSGFLGEMDEQGRFGSGLIDRGLKITYLSGTPIPNRPHEFYHLLRASCPEALQPSVFKYGAYMDRFCEYYMGDRGFVVTGSKNEGELYNRLRGSGFMTRRTKKKVLPQLPDKFYELIVFSENSEIKRILEKEKQFDPEEILKQGVSAHPALPQIRREMGVAKVPLIADFVKYTLDSVEKVLIGVIHQDVVSELTKALEDFSPAVISGKTPPTKRQTIADRFQKDPDCRVFIGNLEAAGEGLDLTAASEVILAEPDWVPRKNEQFIDRSHRIGQDHKVNVHMLVVENSLDAYILGTAVEKSQGINKILDGE